MCKTSLHFFEMDFYFYADSDSAYCTINAMPVSQKLFMQRDAGQSEKNSLNCYVLSNTTCAQRIEKCIRHSIATGNRKMRF